jgi:hypothetical protein
LGVGLTTYPVKRKLLRTSKKYSRIFWRRPRPKLGCGAKERRRRIIFYRVLGALQIFLSFITI